MVHDGLRREAAITVALPRGKRLALVGLDLSWL